MTRAHPMPATDTLRAPQGDGAQETAAVVGRRASDDLALAALPPANVEAEAANLVERRAFQESRSHTTRNFFAALSYLGRGWRPLPASASDKRPLLNEWAPYQRRSPTRAEVESWLPLFAYGVALVMGDGLAAVDVDVERPGFDSTITRLRDDGGAEVRTPSGGSHFYFRAPTGTATSKTPHFEVQAVGAIVMAPPSPGYVWRTYPSATLPSLPTWIAAETAPTASSIGAELEAYRILLPDLRFDPTRQRGEAKCPLHEDTKPSLSIFAGRSDGALLWRCFACKRGGRATGLQRLVMREGSVAFFANSWAALEARVELQDVCTEAKLILTAIVQIGRERDLDPRRELGMPYRVLARKTDGKVERVTAADGLSHNGARIRAAILQAQAHGLLAATIVEHRTTRVRILGEAWR